MAKMAELIDETIVSKEFKPLNQSSKFKHFVKFNQMLREQLK